MNLMTPTTMGELRQILAAADDHAGNHVLWIDVDGGVHLTLADAAAELPHGHLPAHPPARLRFAPFEQGSGAVGPDAARDDELVGDLYFSILHQWMLAGDAPPGIVDIDIHDFTTQQGWLQAAAAAECNHSPTWH
jgi:hypothetical protein